MGFSGRSFVIGITGQNVLYRSRMSSKLFPGDPPLRTWQSLELAVMERSDK